MIRINLLSEGAIQQRRMQFHLPPKVLIGSGIGVGVVAVVTAVVVLVGSFGDSPTETSMSETGLAPSSQKAGNVVEDVVRDITDERDQLSRRGYLDLPYEQLSFAEKLNYEALFAKDVSDLLIRAVPDEIGLRSLEVSNFKTIYAVGLSSSREMVNSLFSSMKTENVDLLAPPYSFIKQNKNGGYRFAVTCEAEWGLRLSDPFVDLSLSFLPSRETIGRTVEEFGEIAKKTGISLKRKPARISAEKMGPFRRYEYRISGTGTFVDFTEMLKETYEARVPCAFKSYTLSATSRSQIGIDAVVVFTTKE